MKDLQTDNQMVKDCLAAADSSQPQDSMEPFRLALACYAGPLKLLER